MQQQVTIEESKSAQLKLGGLIISARDTAYHTSANVIVGKPGFPNAGRNLLIGDAILYETPDGLFEVRLLSVGRSGASLLVTRVTPNPGITAGLFDKDLSNSPFSRDELTRIVVSISDIKTVMSQKSGVKPEQLAFILQKLDEMQAASERMGRKDWLNYAIGTLTSIIVTAALDPEIAKALLRAADAALLWVFGGNFRLLP